VIRRVAVILTLLRTVLRTTRLRRTLRILGRILLRRIGLLRILRDRRLLRPRRQRLLRTLLGRRHWGLRNRAHRQKDRRYRKNQSSHTALRGAIRRPIQTS
jgi:hypothetical protein